MTHAIFYGCIEQHQQTSSKDNYSYFRSVCFGEDIIIDIYVYIHISIFCDVVNIFLQCKFSLHTYYLHHYVYKWHILHWNKMFFLKTLDITTIETKRHITVDVKFGLYKTLLRNQTCLKTEETILLVFGCKLKRICLLVSLVHGSVTVKPG